MAMLNNQRVTKQNTYPIPALQSAPKEKDLPNLSPQNLTS